MGKNNSGVKDDSSSSSDDQNRNNVENESGSGNDKDTNLANLRKQLEEKDVEIERLKAGNGGQGNGSGGDRSLNLNEGDDDDEDDGDKGGKKGKEDDDELSSAEKIAFNRDLQDVARGWNKEHNVSDSEWAEIQKKVTFTGKELRSEILEKINEAHQSLPTVRQQREKALKDEGRKEAMREIQDQELDLGGGGEGDMGEGGGEPRFTPKERRWMDAFGVGDDTRKKINKSKNTNQWEEGKSPRRKFFEGAR